MENIKKLNSKYKLTRPSKLMLRKFASPCTIDDVLGYYLATTMYSKATLEYLILELISKGYIRQIGTKFHQPLYNITFLGFIRSIL